MARPKKTKKRTNAALLLVLIALAVFLGIELIQVNQRLGEAKVQEASLTRQMQMKQQENQALQSDLDKKDDPEFIKELRSREHSAIRRKSNSRVSRPRRGSRSWSSKRATGRLYVVATR